MHLPKFDYLAPKSLPEAVALSAERKAEALFLAGGTDLVVRLRQRVATPKLLISLNSLPDMDYITYTPKEGLRIGALTPIHSLETSKTIQQVFGVLAQAANKIASPQIRNMATLGGNLCLDTRCWYYNKSYTWRQSRSPCYKTGGEMCHVIKSGERCYALFSSDMAPPLMALGTKVKLFSNNGERLVPIQELYSGVGQSPLTLSPGEIITEIEIPPRQPETGTVYLKHSFREAVEFAIVGVAASITLRGGNGTCAEAHIAIGAVASAPVKATKAENVLKGNKISAKLIEQAANMALKDVGPIVPIGTTVDYKRKMIGFLVRQAINEAWDLAKTRS